MTQEKLLGLQVKRLLSDVSEHGNRHLAEVEADLAQTDFLLSQAIQKLGASFMAIHEAVCAQQQSMNMLLTDCQAQADDMEKLRAIQDELSKQVHAAMTGLQFQDMTSQLIGRTVQRVTGVREVLAALGTGSNGMVLESGADQIVEILHKLNAAVTQQVGKLENLSWKPVQQTHMESGEIELF